MPAHITITALDGFPLVQPGDDLPALILDALAANSLTLQDGDVLVVAHKVVSKAEGRLIRLADVVPSPEADALARETGKDPRFLELVLRESREIVRTRPGLVIAEHRHGWICANAAIDRSNVQQGDDGDDYVLLLPKDPDASARMIRQRLQEATGATIAVIINDTHGRPFRIGAMGVAIGVAGLAPVSDLRGEKDLFGYTMQTSEIATADELAAAASLLQGQTAQGRPVVLIRGAHYQPDEQATARQLVRPRELDLFR
ncbi:coenzyme F420-0:L-glutamate ligase / coenzyme F420-1:gamma-L-glutamate ligase [Ardenticatena maritima]|uniref:Coenzyme F420-0:L-glutamate ligase / coenzyme F420-1:gamma-L-glutamate ligase n=1 Tax=Ardenticatena maritima TaxID=872965 RepID=A0A0M8K6S8_9CHLR|nr:coenzyme F420-0:L-glutamate ligase [Ardenticatena maritima]KPL86498.1 hypothetical protein SE16_14570 [Ardenticatena maritima]GAP62973.1 coenzyme F420-0:L-glutamate ligase / coenzyme F420-1:gamma-L-glutamate ligase [Ardenticatena maritima]